MADLKFIPDNAGSKSTELSLDQIPEDIRKDVDEAYKLLKANQGRFRVSFPSEGEANAWILLAKAYCKVRPDGEIKFRKSNTRDLPAGTFDFRVTDLMSPAEQQVADIRATAEQAKAAGGAK